VKVYWVEQALDRVPDHDEWLAQSELSHLQRLHVAKRRDDWRLGRWTAKRAVAIVLQVPHDGRSLKEIAILADPSGAPRAYIGHESATVSISLSHRDGIAVCAISQSMIPLGCDLELIEARSDSFIADYFTEYEQTIIAQGRGDQRDQLVTTLWSAKESALKALQVGLRVDTGSVQIRLCRQDTKRATLRKDDESDRLSLLCLPNEWHPLQAHCQNAQVLYGWWSCSTSLVRTIVAIKAALPPSLLTVDNSDYSPCTP
jgi:4'-phosphopantetheinyl transferase